MEAGSEDGSARGRDPEGRARPTHSLRGARPRAHARRDLATRRSVRLLASVLDRGGALAVLRGPGSGSSTLLAQAVLVASPRDMLVLDAAAPESARELPFAGLRRLLGARPPAARRPPAGPDERASRRVRDGARR